MLKYILVLILSFNLYALEISMESAKENHQTYSILHFKDSSKFLCQEKRNDFEVVTKIICAFSKKPSQKIQKIQNSFFQIDSTVKNGTFFLMIKPNYKIKLFPMAFNLIKDSSVYQADVKISKHWMLIGYKDKLPYINNRKKSEKGLNLPFVMKKDILPYVGGLDIKGNPVHLKKVQDVTDYLKIKKYYKEKKYTKCLELINDVLYYYPNSLFKAELLFYQIRVYARVNDFDNVVELSKVYLREYSADKNVPEVLAYTANAYSKIGLNIDADYFFDRLFDEHLESEYSKWGYIYKGDMLEMSGGATKAISFYKKALKETEDIEIATTAAYKLALYYSGSTKLKEASKYSMKIVKAKPDFFKREFKNSLDMMYIFAENSDYKTASAIAKSLIDEINKRHDEYERLLKDRALWLSKTEDTDKALSALNRYLKEYPDGDFEAEVRVAKDSLFFATSEDNLTAKLDEYNSLIVNYRDDAIGDRAIYEKSKLLLKNGMYADVLGFEESVLELDSEKYSDTKEIIKDAAKGSMTEYLKQDACPEVLSIFNEYNVTLSDEWDEKIYVCAEKGANVTLAKSMINKNINIKDVDERKKWLYRNIKIDFMMSKYQDVIGASGDLISFIEDDIEDEKNREYLEIYRYLFDTYQRVSDSQKMLSTINNIQDTFGLVYKDIERYVSILSIGQSLRDDNIIIKYAEYIVKLQNKTSAYTQSPYVEFTLYQAYIANEDLEKALEIIKSLDTIELSKNKRARQKYLLGSVYSKLWRDDEARVAYQEAVDTDASSAWGRLAKSAQGI